MILPPCSVSAPSLASLLCDGTAVEPQTMGTFGSLLTQQQALLPATEQPGHEPTVASLPLAALEMAVESEPTLAQGSKETPTRPPGEPAREEREEQALYSILQTLQAILQQLPADFSLPGMLAQTPPVNTAAHSTAANATPGVTPGTGTAGAVPGGAGIFAGSGAPLLARPDGPPPAEAGRLPTRSQPVATGSTAVPGPPVNTTGRRSEVASGTPPLQRPAAITVPGAAPLRSADGTSPAEGSERPPLSLTVEAAPAPPLPHTQETHGPEGNPQAQVSTGTGSAPLDESVVLRGHEFVVGAPEADESLAQTEAPEILLHRQPGHSPERVPELLTHDDASAPSETLPLQHLPGKAPEALDTAGATAHETTGGGERSVQLQPTLYQQHADSLPGHSSDQSQQFLAEGQRQDRRPVAHQSASPVSPLSDMMGQISPHLTDADAPPVRSEVATPVASERQASLLQRGSLSATEAEAASAAPHLPRHTILLQLDPPELGAMQIRVRLTHEHLAASFWADSPEVRALIQSHFPTLNQTLSAQGFHEHQISMSLATGGFGSQPGQFAQQHSAFHTPVYNKEQGMMGRRPGDLDTPRPVPHRYGRQRIVDVVI